jgi:hypothetical protein
MSAVFADTFYYLALINADDNRHEELCVVRASAKRSQPTITSSRLVSWPC